MLKLKRYPKRSPYYYIRGTIGGKLVFESTQTVERERAEAFRLKREREIYDTIKLGVVRPATFADAVNAYLDYGKGTKYIARLLQHFGMTPLEQIGQGEVDRAANALYPDAAPSTLNRQVYGPVVAILRHAVAARLPGATVPLIKHRKTPKPVIQPADDEHIAKLLPFCSEGLRALITLMTYTGLRTGEALRIKPEDVKDDYIAIARTKNGKSRLVPVPSGWHLPSVGFGFTTSQGVGRAIRRASRAAGLPYHDAHELGRHAFAARWLRNGGTIIGLMKAGGWESYNVVVNHYGHMEQSPVHDTMRELSKGVQKMTENK